MRKRHQFLDQHPVVYTTLFALLALMLPTMANAQFGGGQLAVPNSPAFEKAASTLRVANPRQYEFSKSTLSDVLRLMAEDAGISFFGLPDGSNGAERLVTFTINASPFSALETLAKANGISLIYDNGIWYLRPADDRELVGRIYQINYNSQEMVRKNDQTSGVGGGGEGGVSSIGLDLQGSPDFFVREPSRLLEDIRSILDLGTTGDRATIAPTTSVDALGQLNLASLTGGQPNLVVRPPSSNLQGEDSGDGQDSSPAKVIWNSDSNSLYIVATRQQHQWIEGYLAAADRPQPMIAIQVQFIEINKDPRREFGVDWSGTFQEGRGWGGNLELPDSGVNLQRLGDYSLPTSAILSYDDVNLRLRALFNETKSKIHSFPRMVTLDNREVSFRSVVNQPVLASSSAASLGAGATETNSVEYIPIGTVINILPKRMANNELMLNISITVSDIIGERIINGNPFPVATSRVYTAPVTVEDGYSVAISGLDQAQSDEQKTGIPVLGRIPIIGNAFRTNYQSEGNQHLLMIITPRLLSDKTPGVNEDGIDHHPWTDNFPSQAAENHGELPAAPIAATAPAQHPAHLAANHVASPITAAEPARQPQTVATAPRSDKRLRLHERLFGKKNRSNASAPSPQPTQWVAPEAAAPTEATPMPVAAVEPTRAEPVVIASTDNTEILTSFEELDASDAVDQAENALAEEKPVVVAETTPDEVEKPEAATKIEVEETIAPVVVAETTDSSDSIVAPGQGLAWNDDSTTTMEEASVIEAPALSFEEPIEEMPVIPEIAEVTAEKPIVVEAIIEDASLEAETEPEMIEPVVAAVAPAKEVKVDTPKKPAPAPAPAAATPQTPAPVSGKPRWEGEELAGGPKSVSSAVEYIEQSFAKVDREAPNAAEQTNELYAESERLLKFLQDEDEAAGNDRPTYSDDWWKLIELKAKTKRATQQIAPNMATLGNGELPE